MHSAKNWRFNSRIGARDMASWFETMKRFRFYLLVGAVHLVSLFLLFSQSRPMPSTEAITVPSVRKSIKKEALAGRPVNLYIPDLNLRLIIEDGVYNETDATWSLSGYNAHFANITMPANNQEGNTLVYGHNNKHVFGPLKKLQPGAEVEIRADNGHLFYYSLVSTEVVQPNDVSIFTYEGPPMLTLQTCTGNWHELRTFSKFRLTRTIKYNPNAERDRAGTEELKQSMEVMTNPAFPDLKLVTI